MVDLPIPMDQILKNLDAVIITHTHIDHWDECAAKAIPKYITIFVQNASDKKVVAEQGFQDIRVAGVNTPFKGITITKTGAQHGSDEMLCIPFGPKFAMNVWDLSLNLLGKKLFMLQEILFGMNMSKLL